MFTTPETANGKKIIEVTGGTGATYTGGAFVTAVNSSVAGSGVVDIVMVTGANQIVVDAPVINTNSQEVEIVMYEDTAYSGGTDVDAFTTDRNSPISADITALKLNPTVSDPGTQISPDYNIQGTAAAGSSEATNLGLPIILKPLTNHLFRMTNLDGQTRQINLNISAHRRR